MKTKSTRRDFSQVAFNVVQIATGEAEPTPAKNAGNRKGGLKGGKKRAESLTPEQRSEIARIAAFARWKKSD